MTNFKNPYFCIFGIDHFLSTEFFYIRINVYKNYFRKQKNLTCLLIVMCLVVFSCYVTAQPAIKVLGIDDAEQIEKQLQDMLAILDVNEKIQITVKFYPLPKNLLGLTTTSPALGEYDQSIQVLISDGLPPKKQALVLAHEMIHVKQFAKNELAIIDKKDVMWKGQRFTDIDPQNIWSPWEQEAHMTGNRLLKRLNKADKIFPDLLTDESYVVCNSD